VSLPVTVNLEAYRGDSWSQTFRLLSGTNPIDLTGAVIECEARSEAGAVHALTIARGQPGEVTISLPSASIPFGTYAYDLEITEGGVVTTWVRGKLALDRDVTNELP